MIVLKLGGSSQTPEGYLNLLSKINNKTVIVVSAIKNVTNNLLDFTRNKNAKLIDTIININKSLISNLNLNITFFEKDINYLYTMMYKQLDLQDKINLVASGETFTAKILNQFLNTNNIKSEYLDTIEFINCDLKNDNIFNKGKFTVDNKILNLYLEKNNVIVVPGFRGKNIENQISLMGRGGSDTTGALIAASLNTQKYEIWTDVNGLYSADPNNVKHSIIINNIDYDIAQEISAMGAKVIHPYCIKPCQQKNIPIEIRNTYNYNSNYTTIKKIKEDNNNIYAITNQKNITIFKIESLDMWNNYGFVYDIFSKFKEFNVDVNIINTSQFDIATTTDDIDIEKLEKLKKSLEEKYNVTMINNCNCISVVGNNIKKNKKLNAIVENAAKFEIKLTSYSSNDMTLSFVLENRTDLLNPILLENSLHKIIFPFYNFENPNNPWWNYLLEKDGPDKCQYVYSLSIIKDKISELKQLTNIDHIYYAMKANNNKHILTFLMNLKFGIETVSIEEVKTIFDIVNEDYVLEFKNIKILFTPNFADINDYQKIFQLNTNNNIKIIIDNIDIIKEYPYVFKNKNIGLRLDLNYGFGHCNKVITQGQESKFGVTNDEILNNIELFKKYDIKITGLHSHMGSGISDYKHWVNNLKLIIDIYKNIPIEINDIEWFDIGGGFGIDNKINFNQLNIELGELKLDNVKLFIEPGRFIVAESGIIWGKVTQTKYKSNTKFIGTNIGMTDIIRPALYSAVHPIYFKDTDNRELVTVVGPICESGDVLIKNINVSKDIKIGNSIIVANTGAYGFVMASQYNNRCLPAEIII